MPRFAANLSFLYQDLPFLDRFQAAAEDGFKGVEYLFPYEYEPEVIAAVLQQNGLEQVLFNAPPGSWVDGERGLAALPGREDEFKDSVQRAIDYAKVLGNRVIHFMAGIVPEGNSRDALRSTYVSNIAHAANRLSAQGLTALIEPINLRDMPGYFLNEQAQAHAIREEIGADNLKVQFDLYHAQVVEGDLETKLRRWNGSYSHVQIASVPTRNEPDIGEVNYPHLFQVLDELDYSGWIGCEYRPKTTTREGLGWFRKMQAAQPTIL